MYVSWIAKFYYQGRRCGLHFCFGIGFSSNRSPWFRMARDDEKRCSEKRILIQ